MEKLSNTDEISVFSLLKKQITEFKPLKLVDFEANMINNELTN